MKGCGHWSLDGKNSAFRGLDSGTALHVLAAVYLTY